MEGLGTTLRKLLDALDSDVQAHYDASGSGFRPRYYPVARLLLADGSCSIRSMADQTGVSHSAVSQTVTEMRAAGLVTSAPGKDGRERLVSLTDAGQAACARLQPLWSAVERAAALLDAELSASLRALLRETQARLDERSFASRIADQLQEPD